MTTNTSDTFYDILNCDSTASTDELKKSYQSLILKYHPDKDGSTDKNAEIFIQLNEAWNVLRDGYTRSQYDAEIMQKKFSENRIVHEIVSLEKDFRFDQNSESYCRDCRCGAMFVVAEEDVDGTNCYLECDECSLVISVTLCDTSRDRRK